MDDLAGKFGASDVVKIDVERYESKVLEGATDTLAVKPDWYVEVHPGLGLEDNGGSTEQIVQLFRDGGIACISRMTSITDLLFVPSMSFHIVGSNLWRP